MGEAFKLHVIYAMYCQLMLQYNLHFTTFILLYNNDNDNHIDIGYRATTKVAYLRPMNIPQNKAFTDIKINILWLLKICFKW